MPAKRKQFKKPPLIEVFCEFFFESDPEKEVHSVVVAKFWRGKIKADFPRALQPSGPPTPRDRFASEDGKTILQVGENLLVVNQLPPYYGWERFEPKVIESFEHYTKLWKPKNVARAAVHYIDKIDIPKAEANLEDYFHLLPGIPDFPPSPVTNVTLAYEVKGAKEGDIVAVTMRQPPSANPEGMAFMFQWDYVATKGLPASSSEVTNWLKGAHDYLGKMFLGAFTDKCLKLFDSGED